MSQSSISKWYTLSCRQSQPLGTGLCLVYLAFKVITRLSAWLVKCRLSVLACLLHFFFCCQVALPNEHIICGDQPHSLFTLLFLLSYLISSIIIGRTRYKMIAYNCNHVVLQLHNYFTFSPTHYELIYYNTEGNTGWKYWLEVQYM